MRETLPVVTVDLGEGVRAAFTTSSGGVSTGDHATLNLGLGVGDRALDVLTNRALDAGWGGGPVRFGTQVHGRDVVVAEKVTSPAPGPDPSAGECDGLVSSRGRGVGVLVADCVPVLLADPVAGVVGAVHAGRRGLVAGVVQAALATMVAEGARANRVRAAIGPAICGCCYEVPDLLRAEVADVVPETWGTTTWGTPALDLPAGVAALLRAAGVGSIHRVEACTRTDDRFYSYRRAQATGASTGRFAGVVIAAGRVPGVSFEDSTTRPC